MPTTGTDADTGLDALLGGAAGLVVAGTGPAAFIEWVAEEVPRLVPDLLAEVPDDPDVRRSYLCLLGRLLWNRMPQPDHRYRVRPLARPERNERCVCGSGRKYKQCCASRETLLDGFPETSLLPFVLDHVPAARFAELPFVHLMPEEVAHVAATWLDEGAAERAVDLLRCQIAGTPRPDARHSPSFNTLLDALDELGRFDERQAVLDMGLAAQDPQLRSDALVRLAFLAADAGDATLAWKRLREAERLTPGDAVLARLEVLLLLNGGEPDQARERARDWLAYLRRDDPDGHAAVIDWLAAVAGDPAAEGVFALDAIPDLAALAGAIERAPPPECHYRLEPAEGGACELVPDGRLAGVNDRWGAIVDQPDPLLAGLVAEPAIDWSHAADIVEFLDERPLAWSSFEVLDDLVLSLELDRHRWNGLDERVVRPLLARGEALLRAVLAADGTGGSSPGWARPRNRPALRLVVNRARSALARGEEAEAVRLMQWYLEVLDPADATGLRRELVPVLLAAGRAAEALALLDRHPGDDLPGMPWNRVLALWIAGRQDDAAAGLEEALAREREVGVVLAADGLRRPAGAAGAAAAVANAAWRYRSAMHETWRSTGALDWLRARVRRS